MSDYDIDAASYEAASEPFDPTPYDEPSDSRIDRLDYIDDQLQTETDPELIARLTKEREQLQAMLDDESIVGGWREGETMRERNARLLARDAATRQSDRPEGTKNDPPKTIAEELTKEHKREVKRLPVPGELGSDAGAVRRFLRAGLEANGLDAAEHLKRPPRGKPTEKSRDIREALAPLVVSARARGAKLEAIAAATNRTVGSVQALLRDAPAANP